MQGALCLGLDAAPLDAAALGTEAFLPGGVWFMVACFGGGTPATSAYHPWLRTLADQGGDMQAAREVLRSLPRPGEPPFLAALPQAALANPKGPLAVIAHMDLAWTFAFMDNGRGSRASRIFGALRALLSGSRAGVALDVLMQAYREANDDLTAGYQLQRDAAVRGQDDRTDTLKLARLWMRRNDLRGYVVLGDPAVHLPLARARARIGEPGMSSLLIDLRLLQRPAVVAGAAAAPVPEPTPQPQPPAPEEPIPLSFTAPPPAQPSPPTPPAPLPPAPVSAPASVTAPVPVSPATAPAASERSARRIRERAVLALLRGGEAPQQIAARHGVELDDLFDWLERYRSAGRGGLDGP
jgi:hypothetical protein